MENYDAIILGGGITGLFVAYRLSKKGKKILLVEKSKDLGGLLSTLETRGDPIERYYHHVFVTDNHFLDLIKELEIEDNFDWFESSLGFYHKGKIYDMSVPTKILTFEPLTFFEKIRFGLIALKIKMIKNPSEFDDVPADEWIVKNAGEELYRKFFYPMLKSKYGSNLHNVSACWFIERIKLRTKGGLKREKLGYMKGGFYILVKKLEEKILENKGKIIKGKAVEKIVIRKNAVQGIMLDKKLVKSNYVLSTLPLPVLSKFTELPREFREKISKIKYQGAVCILLGLNKKLTDFYWTNIIDNSLIGALIEHTNLLGVERYKDHIVYLASYIDFDSEIWKMDDKKVFEKYFLELQKLFPEINKENVVWWNISRDKNAGIIYEIGYNKIRVGNETPIKGLIIGGMFNNYPERSIDLALVAGEKMIRLMES